MDSTDQQASPPTPASDPGVPHPSQRPAKLDADLENEIAEAMRAMDSENLHSGEMTAASAGKPAIRGPRVVTAGREERTGKVVSVGPSDVFVEFGPKELGVVDRTQFKTEEDLPTPGDDLKVVVNKFEPTESIYICSLPGTVQKADWERLEAGQTVEARVTGTNKGGLELEVAGHHAFMPASQVGLDRIGDLSVFVGEKLVCQVQRIDRRGRGNIVLSRRDVLQAERAEQAGKLRDSLAVGQTVEGTVRKIMPFGAFVDLGGIDGLVHLSDLSHDRVGMGEKAVARFVEEGQRVKVVVLKIDWDANRISLGMKQLQEDPFVTASNELTEEAEVTGRVTKILEFGAFVEIAPGVEGLVHISELDWRRVANVEDVVKQDEVIKVKIIKIDPDTRKVSLSLKQTRPAPERPAGGPGGPKGAKGKGRGRGEQDTRSPDEILKETPAFRRMREEAQKKQKQQSKSGGGLGDFGGLGSGLGDLKL